MEVLVADKLMELLELCIGAETTVEGMNTLIHKTIEIKALLGAIENLATKEKYHG